LAIGGRLGSRLAEGLAPAEVDVGSHVASKLSRLVIES